MELRAYSPSDAGQVVAMNQASVDNLAPMDEAHLARLVALADTAQVVAEHDTVGGFAMAMAPGAGYDSEYYRWFEGRAEPFLYLDRVVIAESFRRQGLASLLYDAMEERATQFGRMCCEVNVEPPNHASLAFHAARGYHELARYRSSPTKEVVLPEKPLSESAAAPRVTR